MEEQRLPLPINRRWHLLFRTLAAMARSKKGVSLDEVKHLSITRSFRSFGLACEKPIAAQVRLELEKRGVIAPLNDADEGATWLEWQPTATCCRAVDAAEEEWNSSLRLRMFTHLTHADLTGFNQTGNICLWPSEEVLSHLLLTSRREVWLAPHVRHVAELGGGMTCLAGLVAALAAPAPLHLVLLTDGNPKAASNLQHVASANSCASGGALPPTTQITSMCLEWGSAAISLLPAHLLATFELILCADCIFFEEAHAALLETVEALLSPHGCLVAVAPNRDDSLQRFVKAAQQAGFSTLLESSLDYCDTVARYCREAASSDASAQFQEDIHLPLILTLRFAKQHM